MASVDSVKIHPSADLALWKLSSPVSTNTYTVLGLPAQVRLHTLEFLYFAEMIKQQLLFRTARQLVRRCWWDGGSPSRCRPQFIYFLYYLFIYNIYNVYRIYNIYNIYYIFTGGQPEPESAGGVHQRGGGAGVRPGLVTRCYEDDLSLLILGGQRSLYQCSGQVHGGRRSAPSAGEARGVNDGLSNCKQK